MSARSASVWTPEKVSQLINLYEANECLWNYNTEEYKNRMKRDEAIRSVCKCLDISKDQFAKKIHNLRNQFNFELKKRQKRSVDRDSSPSIKWEYFDRLKFLRKYISRRAGYGPIMPMPVNSPTPSEQANIETEECLDSIENTYIRKLNESSLEALEESRHRQYEVKGGNRHINLIVEDVEESDSVQSKSNNTSYTTNVHSVVQHPGAAKKPRRENQDGSPLRDENDTFGEFIANELRNLNSDFSRKKMKKKIMQAMLEVWNEDDEVNINICLN